MKAWKKERENIEDKYMKVNNLGKEIDNLHKNIVYVEHKRGIKTSARDDIGTAANSDLIIEEQKKRRINDFNLELGSRAYRYQMLVSGKYRNTCKQGAGNCEMGGISQPITRDSRIR